MARERGFIVEVTAFLPAEDTNVATMSRAAARVERLSEMLHELGFSAVAVSSKFTSRKAPDPMPDLDDSKFATNSGTPTDPVLAKAQREINRAVQDGLGIRISDSDPLDIPAAFHRRAKG